MECTFEVGQKICCIDSADLGNFPIAEGDVYTISFIGIDDDPNAYFKGKKSLGTLVLALKERSYFNTNGYPVRYHVSRFRPIQQIDTTATVAALAQTMREAMKKGRIDA